MSSVKPSRAFPVAGDGCRHVGQSWGCRGSGGCDTSAAGLALQSGLHPRLQTGVCRGLNQRVQTCPSGIAQPAALLLVMLLENRLTEVLAMRWCLFSQAPEGRNYFRNLFALTKIAGTCFLLHLFLILFSEHTCCVKGGWYKPCLDGEAGLCWVESLLC